MPDTSVQRDFLVAFDSETEQEAEADLMACCASRRWAAEVAARRPYHDLDTLHRVSDAALVALGWSDVQEALAAHPRIGQRAEGDGMDAAWSRSEQAAATTEDGQTAGELAAANQEYERRFGHVFLICATGLSAGEVLAALHARLGNDENTERRIVREELRKIVNLRLARLVAR
ncbi:MAG TPA: 2-oxo-4-hydroxy-4-carboxy-5-ureidoimidazoline decarboxylase [Pseudonocardiaceae bacterium]